MKASTLIIELTKIMAETNSDPDVEISIDGKILADVRRIYKASFFRQRVFLLLTSYKDLQYDPNEAEAVKVYDDWEAHP